MPNYPNWLTFARELMSPNELPRIIIYVNIRLSSLCFSFRKDIINHKDIILAFFINNNSTFWIMNVYSDFSHTALKYLKDTEVNLLNLLIMAGNFNIRDSYWDLAYPHHSYFYDDLMTVADSFNLELSSPTNIVPTRYSDTDSSSNSTIDLMFLQSGSSELNSHSILPNSQLSLDHAPLTVKINIAKENINSFKYSIVKNSKKKSKFIEEVVHTIKNINSNDLNNSFKLEETTRSLVSKINYA